MLLGSQTVVGGEGGDTGSVGTNPPRPPSLPANSPLTELKSSPNVTHPRSCHTAPVTSSARIGRRERPVQGESARRFVKRPHSEHAKAPAPTKSRGFLENARVSSPSVPVANMVIVQVPRDES